MSVAEIFEAHGEAAFRDGERRVIARLLKAGPQVLALGGGAFCDADTRAEISDKAISIWLDVPVDELVERVKRKPANAHCWRIRMCTTKFPRSCVSAGRYMPKPISAPISAANRMTPPSSGWSICCRRMVNKVGNKTGRHPNLNR